MLKEKERFVGTSQRQYCARNWSLSLTQISISVVKTKIEMFPTIRVIVKIILENVFKEISTICY